MSFDIKQNTITVNDVVYHVEREADRGHPEETLTIKDFSVEQDDWIFPFEGLHGTLGYDEFDHEHANPREWSNVGTMAVSYSNYNLGDEDISKIEFTTECDNCGGKGEDPNGNWVVGIVFPTERLAVGSQEECEEFLYALPDVATGRYYIEPFSCPKCKGDCEIPVHPVDYFKQQGARVVLGLTVYEHSGITMYAGDVTMPFDTDRWDTSFVGFIYDTEEGVKQCIGDNATDEEIEAALRSEVAVYASYLEGDVTCWSVQDDETDFMESCGGYVGDSDECERECFAALEHAIIKRLGENDERAYWNARGTETK